MNSITKKIFLYFLFLLTSIRGFSAVYYIDPAGSDSNDGRSASTAWKTLTKLNNTTFSAGDNILFLRGGVWNGNLTISQNGNSSNPISWGAYGAGPNPLISGFTVASGWLNNGGGIWTYTNPAFGAGTPGIVTINGKIQPIGRYPKKDSKYTSHKGTTSITDPTLNNMPSFVGGEIVIRKNHWTLTRGVVSAQSSGLVTYTGANTYEATDGFTYFFQNNINCLTQLGDWCYNASTKTLSMYFGSMDPVNYSIKVSTQDVLVSFANVYTNSYNSFNGIDFEGANFAFKGTGSSHNTITNCTINAIGDNAINLTSSSYSSIMNNTINDVNNVAIALAKSNTNNCIIKYNSINRVGVIPGEGESDGGNGGSYSGISINDNNASSNIVQFNTLKTIGYNGIQVNGDNYSIDSNFIDGVCSVLDDGAGIYTYTGTAAIVYKGRSITNNIVLNSIGNIPPGLFGPPDGLYQLNEGNGIYLDDNSSNLTVSGNTVANCGASGYLIHNSHEVVFSNNLSYNNSRTQLLIAYDDKEPALSGVQKNLNINNNILIANASSQHTLEFQSLAPNSSKADFTEFGSSDNNHFGSLSVNKSDFQTAITETNGTLSNLPGWKSLSSQESHSTFSAPVYISTMFEYNASSQPKTISLDKQYIDIQNNPYNNTVTLNPYSSFVLIYTGIPCDIVKPIIK